MALPLPTISPGISARPTANLSTRDLSQHQALQQLSPQDFSGSLKRSVYNRPPWRFLSGQDNKRCFGPTLLESLMLNIKDDLFQIPKVEGNAIEECVLQAQPKIDLLVIQGEDKFTGETSLPTAPPFVILGAIYKGCGFGLPRKPHKHIPLQPTHTSP